MDLKEKLRERNEARYFAADTLRLVCEWIRDTNPQNFLSKEASGAIGESFQAKMREYVDRSADLIERTWVLPGLLVDDAIRVLKGATSAEQEGTSEVE